MTGTNSTFATLSSTPKAITSDATHLWVASNEGIVKVALSDATVSSFVSFPAQLSVGELESAGNYLYLGTNTFLRRYSKSDGSWRATAGTGSSGYLNGTGTDAWFGGIAALTSDGQSLFVFDSYRLRRVVDADPLPAAQPSSATSTLDVDPGAVTTIAGSGSNFSTDGVGEAASFKGSGGVVVVDGFAYVASQGYVRKVELATAEVTKLAGNGGDSNCSDGLTSASFYLPTDAATDGHYLYTVSYCGSSNSHRVRRVSLTSGGTSTVATIPGSIGVTYAADGSLYVATDSSTIVQVNPVTGTNSTFATLSSTPKAITSDATHLWVASNEGIVKVALSDATVSSFVSFPAQLSVGELESAGNYLYLGTNTFLRRYSKSDGSWRATAGTGSSGYLNGTGTDAWFGGIAALTSDGQSLFVFDSYRLRRVVDADPLPAAQSPAATTTLELSSGSVSTFAGDTVNETHNYPYTDASFRPMGGMVVVGRHAYVATQGSIRKIDLATGETGNVGPSGWWRFANVTCSDSAQLNGVSFRNLYDLATDGHYLYSTGECGSGTNRLARTNIENAATSTVALIDGASHVTFAPDGFLYVTTGTTGTVVRVDPVKGTSGTFASLSGSTHAITSDATHLWVVVELSGTERAIVSLALADATANTLASGSEIGKDELESAGAYLYNPTNARRQLQRVNKTTGEIVHVAGGVEGGYIDGQGFAARFSSINGLASDGNMVWVADSSFNLAIRIVADSDFLAAGGSSFGWDGYGGWWQGVNATLGNFVTTATDLEIATTGPSLALGRTYNSLDPRVGGFGRGWTFDYEMTWRKVGIGNVAILHSDGRREVHTKEPDGTFSAPPSYYSVLTDDGAGGYDLTMKDRMVYSFGPNGVLETITDANGRGLSLTYSGGKLTQVRDDASGRRLDFVWSADKITEVSTNSVAAHGGPLRWKYYYTGDLLTEACDPRDNDSGGSCITYTYGPTRLTKITRPKGTTEVEVGYLPSGKTDWRANGIGQLTDIQYPDKQSVIVVDPRSNSTRQYFDTKYRVTRQIDAASNETLFEYDADGNRTEVTDPNLNSTVMDYDGRGNMTSSQNPEGETTYYAYDPEDNLIAVRDPRSASAADNTYRTRYEYDAAGNRTAEILPPTDQFPDGIEKSWTYTTGTEPAVGGGAMPPGLVHTEVDGRGKTTTYSYDAAGDLREVLTPSGLLTSYSYDELGRRVSETVTTAQFPLGVSTSYTYDKLGNILTEIGPPVENQIADVTHRRKITNAYDENSNLIETKVEDVTGGDPARITTRGYDAVDRLVSITDPENGTITRQFDEAGNVEQVTDQEGRVFEISYNSRNLPTSVTAKDFVDDPIAGTTPRDIVVSQSTYDPAGRKITETDALARVRELAYDDADRILSRTLKSFDDRDASTRDIVLESFTYDDAGNVLSEETGGGKLRVEHGYDEASRRISSTIDPGGLDRVVTFTYDENGNVLARRSSAEGRQEEVRYAYDDGGRLISEVVENGAADLETTYGYDERGLRTRIVDPRGNEAGATAADFQTDVTYDELGRLVSVALPPVAIEETGGTPVAARPTSRSGYDVVGNPTHQQDPRGAITVASYDLLDRQIQITHPTYVDPDGTSLTPTETYAYDAVGNLVSHTDRRGETTEFTFDKLNRVVQQLDPLLTGETSRGGIRRTYDDVGNLASTIDQRGARIEWTYDDLDRPRTETRIVRRDPGPDDAYTTTYDYDDLSNPTFVENPAGEVERWVFSPASEPTKYTDALSKETLYTFDLASRLVSATDPLGRKAVNEYDLAGRQIEARRYNALDALLTTTAFAYDAAGNQTSVTSPRGFATTYSFDAAGRLDSVVEPVSAIESTTTTFGYDAAGNTTRVTNGEGHATILTYTPWNLPEDTIEPATTAHPTLADRTFTSVYDHAGLPVEERQPSGIAILRQFDELGRLTSESGSGGGAPAASRSFGYDKAGLRTSAGHPSGTISFGYDDRGLLTATSGPAGTSSFDYDEVGRLTGRTDPAGEHAFTWTARGELATAEDPLTGTTLSYSWDDAGQLTQIQYGGGVTPPTRTFAYDDLGRLASDILTNASGTQTARFEYGYDLDSNLTRQLIDLPGNAQAGEHTYSYDRAGRLTSWTRPNASTVAYTWDAAGNRTGAGTEVYTYDERNRLVSGPEGTYTYTPRGTLARIQTGIAERTIPTFDALGRLTRWRTEVGVDPLPPVIQDDVSYTYDSLDRVATRASAAFTYAGMGLDPSSDGTSTFSRLPSGHVLALQKSGQTRFAGTNRHGDLSYLFDTAAAVTDTKVFDPFGAVAAATGSSDPVLGFQSDYTDPLSGHVWMGARWYEGSSASFLSRDTVFGSLSNPVSLNRYTYGFADPLAFFDPDGRNAVSDWFSSGWNRVTGAVRSGWQSFTSTTSSAVNGFVNSVGAQFGRIQHRVVSVVKAITTPVVSTIRSAWRGTTNAITGGAGWGNLARELFSTETLRTGGQAAKGAGTAIKETVTGIAQTISMLTSSEGRKQLGDSMRAIYRDSGGGVHGFLAVVNQFNPAYHALEAGTGYVDALRRGDYEEAGRQGLHLSFAAAETAGVAVGALAAPARARAFADRVSAIGAKAREFLLPGVRTLERTGPTWIQKLRGVLLDEQGGARIWSIRQRLRAAGPGAEFGLPSKGRIRFVPERGYNPSRPLPRGPNGGYIDRFGNEWVVGPSRTPGQPFEWDVQLSRRGRETIGWLSPDDARSHVNVSPLGEVTH